MYFVHYWWLFIGVYTASGVFGLFIKCMSISIYKDFDHINSGDGGDSNNNSNNNSNNIDISGGSSSSSSSGSNYMSINITNTNDMNNNINTNSHNTILDRHIVGSSLGVFGVICIWLVWLHYRWKQIPSKRMKLRRNQQYMSVWMCTLFTVSIWDVCVYVCEGGVYVCVYSVYIVHIYSGMSYIFLSI